MLARRVDSAGWLLVFVAFAGCSGSREGPPRLTGSYRLPERGEKFGVGARGTVYYTTSGYGPRSAKNELKVAEGSGKPGQPLRLDYGAEVKAVVADGRGKLYLGVRDGGDDQIWVFPERWGGDKPEPETKLKPDLPGDLNNLFLGRESDILYALCGDNWIVKLKSDGSVVKTIELPGDDDPEDGGIDAEGNIYLRRSSGPIVKVKPDGTVDGEWAKSEATVIDYVRSVAVDEGGLVYVAASEGDIYLRAYKPDGTLAFNVVAEELEYAPDRIVITPKGYLYALDGDKVYVFRL
jgi:hypothetical protein